MHPPQRGECLRERRQGGAGEYPWEMSKSSSSRETPAWRTACSIAEETSTFGPGEGTLLMMVVGNVRLMVGREGTSCDQIEDVEKG